MIDKLCPRCKVRKPLSAFWNNYASADSKYNYCKECCTTQRREFRQGQKLRIQLLRSVEEVDHKPQRFQHGAADEVDQRIVPQLLSVFQQLEQFGIGRPR